MNNKSPKQQRQQEKFNEQINDFLERILQAYQEKFTDPEATDLDIVEFGILLNNRWKTFCHMRKLNRQAFDIVMKYIVEHNEAYEAQKKGRLPELEGFNIAVPEGTIPVSTEKMSSAEVLSELSSNGLK